MNIELHSNLVAACEMYIMLNKYDTALETLKRQKETIFSEYNHRKTEGVKVGGKFAVILLISMLICGIIIATLIYSAFQTITPESNIVLAFIRVFAPLLLAPVPFIIAFSYRASAIKRGVKKRDEQVKKYQQEVFAPARDKVMHDINGLTNERRSFLQNNTHILAPFPEQYRSNLAVAFMERAVRTGRADSLKEAINLFEEQMHRWNMENYAQQVCEQNAVTTAMMEEQLSRIANNQGKIASSLHNLENLEFYNTFCR